MITEPAPAKLNLALHIRRKRPDGYHDLETLFAFARDGDTVTVAPAEADSFTITGPFASVLRSPPGGGGTPSAQPMEEAARDGSGNLVTRARDAFRRAFGLPPVAITLDKRLPIASGIGGGSADAAATLRALARLTGQDPHHDRLFQIAAELGADVPACLLCRPALGRGRGDRLVVLPYLGTHPVLLVNPRVALATTKVFAGWDGSKSGRITVKGDVLDRPQRYHNDLTKAAIAAAPVVADVLALLDAAPDATFVRMSGSGATCFALFDSEAGRDATAAQAAGRGWWTLATTLL